MSKRQEFSKPVQAEIIKRAMDLLGFIRCEQCKALVKPGWFAIDHIIADGLRVDKTRKLTAKDGQLLCSGWRDSCHGKKTGEVDVPAISQAKRREGARLGVQGAPVQKIQSPGFRPSERTLRRQERGPRPTLPPRNLFIPK